MKAFAITLLIAAGIVLLAPPQAAATTTYVDIDTVFIIYRNYYYSDTIKKEMTDDEVAVVTGEIEKAVDFFWRASNLKCHLNVVQTLIMDRQLTVAQLVPYGAGGTSPYMLKYWSYDGETSVESDLYDAGYVDNDLTIVVALWALEKSYAPNQLIGNAYSGQEWGTQTPNALLGDSIYISVPMPQATRQFERYGVIVHEIEHGLDQLLNYAGYPTPMVNPDQPKTYVGSQDNGETFKFNNINGVPVAYWNGIYNNWATDVTATDADSDGLPDSGTAPITEATLGSSTSSSDSDSDGLSDLDEMQASYHTIADPTDTDSDDDGTTDGADAYPVYDVETTITKGSAALTVDAAIITSGGQDEQYTHVANCNGTLAEHSYDVYMAWTDDVLWFAAKVTDDELDNSWRVSSSIDGIELRIDGDGDGFRYNGENNYRIFIHPQDNEDEDGARIQLDRWAEDGTWYEMDVKDVEAAWTTTANGYIVEMSITEDAFEDNIQFNAAVTLRMQVDSCDRDDEIRTWDLLSQKNSDFDSFADFDLTN